MTYVAFTLISLVVMTVITMAVVISLSTGHWRYRIGVVMLASWCFSALTVYGLKAIGQPLPGVMFSWWMPAGALVMAWALWDVSRLARHYGTTAVIQAADVARGLLLSEKATNAMWSAWARSLPRAAWIKTPDGVMLTLNAEYAERYHKDRADYAGAHDIDLWPQEVAEEFATADDQVFRVGQPIVVVEDAPTPANPSRRSTFLKFPLFDIRGRAIGIGGVELTRDAA